MKVNVYVLLLLLVNISTITELHAQGSFPNEKKVLDQLMEQLTENTDADLDYQQIVDELQFFMSHKININKAVESDLLPLFFLTEQQRKAILTHRIRFGNYLSLLELQSIACLDDNTITLLRCFVQTDADWTKDATPFMHKLKTGKQQVLLLYEAEPEVKKGYLPETRLQDKGYLGPSYRLALRYRFQYNDKLVFGYSGEKDAGEPAPWQNKNGLFDFNSVHFFYKPANKWITSIAVGDYRLGFGQGLTFSTGRVSKKSAFVLSPGSTSQPLAPFRSLSESGFMRGVACTGKFGKIAVTPFFSYKKASAGIVISDSATEAINTIQVSGLHRTANEIAQKNKINETTYGMNVNLSNQSYSVGFTAVTSSFDLPFEKPTAAYQYFKPTQKQISNIGTDYTFRWKNLFFFGEVATQVNGGNGMLSGLAVPLHPRFDLLLLYRKYDKNYHALYANTFGENGQGNNESGMYTAFVYKINRHWSLHTYVDFYQSDWLKYRVDGPSHGKEFLSELQYQPNKTAALHLRYRFERKGLSEVGIAVTEATKRNLRIQYQYQATELISAKTRLEFSKYETAFQPAELGTMLFQDFKIAFANTKLVCNTRFTLFSVHGYNARIYMVENDVLYQYAVPALNHTGNRFYVLLHYPIFRNMECWIKYSITRYADTTTIGTGNEEILGNTVQEIRMQVRLGF